MQKQSENTAIMIWIVALIATLGSLYFSEIRQFEPCLLCWYQRIFMYPLVIIMIIGIVGKDRHVFQYSMILSGIGLAISIYHYTIQKIAFMQDNALSCGEVSCVAQYINWGGFITIPFLAGLAFAIILTLSVLGNRKIKQSH
ncbi:disulfide oxidoreductase [Alkalibacillus almallahensis]|uniref:disulfide oxidoreductase n=1 Tax=Alkalibacillus almallahensis TaxID=1379154 RepID=UPI001421BE5A|nr:disulfide oxidoreductase [Alkalibacillus almallahensis]NIK12014.1 disulfide bond formation protein DsbB [Alkalibacillus almallahensis]